jgi:hypothetical protein
LPSWLDEGLATQNETMRLENGKFRFTPEQNFRRFNDLKTAMRDGMLMSLSTIASRHAGQIIGQPEGNNEKRVAAYYAQLWSLTLFLQHSKYRDSLAKVLEKAQEGTLRDCLTDTKLTAGDIASFTERWNTIAGPAYMRAYFNPNLEQLDAEYRAFLQEFAGGNLPKLPG